MSDHSGPLPYPMFHRDVPPGDCPACGNEYVSGGDYEFQDGVAHQERWCDRCEANWRTTYAFRGAIYYSEAVRGVPTDSVPDEVVTAWNVVLHGGNFGGMPTLSEDFAHQLAHAYISDSEFLCTVADLYIAVARAADAGKEADANRLYKELRQLKNHVIPDLMANLERHAYEGAVEIVEKHMKQEDT